MSPGYVDAARCTDCAWCGKTRILKRPTAATLCRSCAARVYQEQQRVARRAHHRWTVRREHDAWGWHRDHRLRSYVWVIRRNGRKVKQFRTWSDAIAHLDGHR